MGMTPIEVPRLRKTKPRMPWNKPSAQEEKPKRGFDVQLKMTEPVHKVPDAHKSHRMEVPELKRSKTDKRNTEDKVKIEVPELKHVQQKSAYQVREQSLVYGSSVPSYNLKDSVGDVLAAP